LSLFLFSVLLNSHACWSWRKQKFVGEVQCFRGLAEKHVIMVVEFMEGVVGRMVDEAEKMAATDGMLDEMRAEKGS
jgi:DNA polymerase II small subunit/DNA polymerase delta subunit B